MIKLFSIVGILGLLFTTGCASSAYKARLDNREKQAASAGLYCEWIDGDKHSDIDVEINLAMAKRCDSSKNFTLTPYKNSSDANGIMYCCAMRDGESKSASSGKRKSEGPVASTGSASATATAATATSTGAPAAKSATPAAKDSSPAHDDDIVEDK